jgi:zinc protease
MDVNLQEGELLRRSAAGDTEAFGALVTRYQGLVCGLALSACPRGGQSEDLAQEAFVAAWRQLPQLREPSNFRAWLCGIVRRMGANRARSEAARPSTSLDADDEGPAPEPADPGPGPDDLAATAEEIQMVGRALERLPETYREPLVLYYRVGGSVSTVAEALGISDEAVKQRLARGRGILRERLAERLELALMRTAPGPAFTASVLGALPLMVPGAATATAAGAMTKGAGLAKGLSLVALLPWLGAAIGPVVGLAGAWYGWRRSMERATTDEERFVVRRVGQATMAVAVGQTVGLPLVICGGMMHWFGPVVMATGIVMLASLHVGFILWAVLWARRRQALAVAAGGVTPFQGCRAAEEAPRSATSAVRFLGLPLWDVQWGSAGSGKTAQGWLAIGGRARGVVAVGGVATGVVAFGGLAFGGLAVGGLAAGVISLGGAAFGGLSIGGMAAGWYGVGGLGAGYAAAGGAAIGWRSALGGLAVAHDFALGGLALAAHANDEAARAAVQGAGLIRWAGRLGNWASILTVLWVVPLVVRVAAGRRRDVRPKA